MDIELAPVTPHLGSRDEPASYFKCTSYRLPSWNLRWGVQAHLAPCRPSTLKVVVRYCLCQKHSCHIPDNGLVPLQDQWQPAMTNNPIIIHTSGTYCELPATVMATNSLWQLLAYLNKQERVCVSGHWAGTAILVWQYYNYVSMERKHFRLHMLQPSYTNL